MRDNVALLFIIILFIIGYFKFTEKINKDKFVDIRNVGNIVVTNTSMVTLTTDLVTGIEPSTSLTSVQNNIITKLNDIYQQISIARLNYLNHNII